MLNLRPIPSDRMNQIIEIFQRFGYRSPSMLDIACELAISKKTLYLYVQNKEELIQKSIESMKIDFEQRINTLHMNRGGQRNLFNDWFQLIVDFHQAFSASARQDLYNFSQRFMM